MKKPEGFSVIEVVLVVVAVAVIGVVGWLAFTNVLSPKASETTKDTPTTSVAPITIENESDLENLEKSIGDLNLEDTDNTEFETAVSKF